MNTSVVTTVDRRSVQVLAWFGDYLELTKPRIVFLVLVSVATAVIVASWGQPDPRVLIHALLGTALVAASGSAVNQWLERRRDALMERTADRPLVAGRLSTRAALIFSLATVCVGLVYLGFLLNGPTAAWALATWLLYVGAYTPLKAHTWLNTPVGAVAGALPVVIGWAATGSPLDLRLAGLFLIVFLWQFPHFMAIAWLYREQYGRAGMKMLTVIDPTGRRAGLQASVAAFALLPVSLVPVLATPGAGAWIYAVLVLVLGLAQAACAASFLLALSESTARRLLRASLIYLPVLLILLMFVPWM